MFFFFTGPPSPQNIIVGSITIDQIQVHWTLPDTPLNVHWMFLVRYVDMSTDQEKIVRMTNISRISETSVLQSYTAMIGGLESHRKYRIDVSTVTQLGIESCEQAVVTVQTGKYIHFCSADIFYSIDRCMFAVILKKKNHRVQRCFTFSFQVWVKCNWSCR